MSILQTAADITVLINSDVSSSERRVNPSWTISTLKSKLLPITGIPPSSQQLTLRLPHAPQPIPITAEDEDATTLAGWPLQAYAEIHVTDLRPPSSRLNLTDVSEITKWEMPVEQYEKRSDSVRAWKERNQLGRFDTTKQAQTDAEKDAAHERLWRETKAKGIEVGKRCLVGGKEGRRGTVRYVGEVEEIPAGGVWVGVEGDEPTGKNDGSIQGKAYFSCKPKHGSFVRPDRVEIGDFPEVNDLELEDLEEM
ncbi:CAP Gly-rich domain-containing protein [Tricharina praecox]|uniref:CAP Gly-rich domain-containing protein n=1 Tax=Tricharina praecox TaxID=43433 RepID=UPI00221FC7F8|nr:CAP Gly-rich domain-containing protein [Tricharina praecox]KAI5852290.1 CAP Gly-rich domain-containing protein [Tricharina praecox]